MGPRTGLQYTNIRIKSFVGPSRTPFLDLIQMQVYCTDS